MGRCWTCGSVLAKGVYSFTCPFCSAVIEQRKIRELLEPSGSLYEAVKTGLSQLASEIELISSIFEWGFIEIAWMLDQMTEILRSIDKTLKTPSQTQANEWRQIAEELRRRGLLEESETFFLKSLEANPLDYRTYIGLGKTYLQMGMGEKAREYWQKSLPHAPKGKIDYKSYSYRLIGRLDFCENNPQQAAMTLKKAIDLSPHYYLAHYDYAQYCALIGDKEECLKSLRIAIIEEPLPFELVENERNFLPLKDEVNDLLEDIKSDQKLLLRRKLKLLGEWAPELYQAAEKEAQEAQEIILQLVSLLEDDKKKKRIRDYLDKLEINLLKQSKQLDKKRARIHKLDRKEIEEYYEQLENFGKAKKEITEIRKILGLSSDNSITLWIKDSSRGIKLLFDWVHDLLDQIEKSGGKLDPQKIEEIKERQKARTPYASYLYPGREKELIEWYIRNNLAGVRTISATIKDYWMLVKKYCRDVL